MTKEEAVAQLLSNGDPGSYVMWDDELRQPYVSLCDGTVKLDGYFTRPELLALARLIELSQSAAQPRE